jgi:hypothetical protein
MDPLLDIMFNPIPIPGKNPLKSTPDTVPEKKFGPSPNVIRIGLVAYRELISLNQFVVSCPSDAMAFITIASGYDKI